ncbi:hypothetical protein ACFWAY_17845 [Rhodococcus sp. NPDC059968]|uniref:hypothetical protein n=1 Tax=Rhodococcus sp. NPDC059968 TaxID=3347017 RepID=UPI003670A629
MAERILWMLVGGYLFVASIILLLALVRFLRACIGQRTERSPTGKRRDGSVTGSAPAAIIPEFAFREADPLIYSQFWLRKQGLAVTWHNPDIHLELASAPGVAVDASALSPDTEYRVFARIWNRSTDGPAADVEVRLSYIDFGIGGVSVPIDFDKVDVPVKGAAGSPGVAKVDWRTPPRPGHYCLQVLIVWPYDANPDNNLGQHNVDVKPLNSPTARFIVPVRNTLRRDASIRLVADGYDLPPRRLCPPETPDAEERARRARAEHDPLAHPVPAGWRVDFDIDDQQIRLVAGETVDVQVTVTAPDGFVGRQAINVNGFEGGHLIGGVTLIAEGVA